MRENWYFTEIPQLNMHVDYTYLTAGELGNILIRFQSCIRSLQNIKTRYQERIGGEPHFIVKSFNTENSAELWIAIAGLAYSVVLQPFWQEYARLAWRRLIGFLYHSTQGNIQNEELEYLPDDVEAKLTKGTEENFRLVTDLSELNKEQAKKLADFVYSLVYPTEQSYIRDDETELYISLRRPRR